MLKMCNERENVKAKSTQSWYFKVGWVLEGLEPCQMLTSLQASHKQICSIDDAGMFNAILTEKKKKKRGYLQWYCSERSLSSPLAVPCQWCLLLLLSNAPLNKPSSMGSTGVTCTWVLFLCNSMPWMGCPMRSQVASAQFLVSAEFGGSIKKKWHHNHNVKKGVNEKIQQWYSSRRFYKNTKFLTESQWGTLCLYSMFGQLCGTQVLSS